ncbi:jg17377 [Pararge aegeria aegeria]|uniref:Jg17377 protein n=1 Tax=Pararge aegeria aegeria TaxID=348720 RepID=A0A8S4RZG8_9NEOP|nr:jg17377 [Pararge aegeria aegeria]
MQTKPVSLDKVNKTHLRDKLQVIRQAIDLPMDTLNIKPLSQELEWSLDAPSGVGATREVVDHAPTAMACTSSEERQIRRVTGRWGAEWLS